MTLLLLCCSWLISGTVFSQNLITGAVRGHVTDTSTTKLPIEGVRVVLVNADGSETVAETDNNGAFEMVGLAHGRYLLGCYKDGYWDVVGKQVTVVAGGNHDVSLRTAEHAETGAVRGNVVNPSTTQLPIEGVRVVLVAANGLETEGETASNGEFRIVGLVPGRYLLSIYKAGYEDRTGKPVTVIAGGEHYVPLKTIKAEPPWLLLICLGVAVVLIVGIAIVVGLRDRPSD
ncbi:carboxypeptidase regulatory-like domain-containing protein [Candidatus Poribacteria bacterium]|nr:carboxypeptidase regulatory-like domain-containing protein [Candidatus Poribacteria bacterium]